MVEPRLAVRIAQAENALTEACLEARDTEARKLLEVALFLVLEAGKRS